MRYDTSSRKGRWLQVFLRQYGVSKFTICNHGTHGCLSRYFRPDLLAAALRATGQPPLSPEIKHYRRQMMRRVLNRLRHDPRFFEQLQRDSNFFTSTLDFRVAVWMTFERACRALPHLKSDYLDQLLKDTWVGSLRDNGWTQCADVGLWWEMEGLRRRGQVA